MNVRLDVVVSAVARDAGLDPDRNTQDKINIVGFINDTRREIYDLPHHLQALEFVGEIVGVAVVTAGTVAVTNGNAEVTGSSTAFSTGMSGRYISVGNSSWQRISFVSDTTHLTLESGWQGDSGTGQSYKIWKRFYELPPKVSKVDRMAPALSPNRDLAYYDPREFNSRFGLADNFGDPVAFTQQLSSDFGDAFLGSTVYVNVSSTANSPILNFTGATLISNLFPGDSLKIGESAASSTAFAVDKILTDNKIALRNYVSISSSGLSATALSNDRLVASFAPGINSTKIFQVYGTKQVHELSNNSDLLEKGWYSAILKGAVAKAFAYVRDPREESKKDEYSRELQKLVRNQQKALNPAPRLKPYIGSRYGGDSTPTEDRDTY